jgi:hypothetical protein
MAPLAGLSDDEWNAVLAGSQRSTSVDGTPFGTRTLADGSSIDLVSVVNAANCGKSTTCSAADLTGNATGDRPWGANNPVWRPFAYGPLAAVVGDASVSSPFYVVVMVGDDPAENDNDPSRDGSDPSVNPGSGVLSVRAEAFGPRGAHRVVELTAARRDAGPLRVLTWSKN